MRIVTNPGSNLSQRIVERYDIDVMPQQIVVDGKEFDTRNDIELEQIDRWVQMAREHPYVLGTSAAEFAKFFAEVGANDPAIVAVMTSRKIIQSHDAACSAARTLASLSTKTPPIDVRVVDTGVTDAGAGLVTIMAALAREAGLPLNEIQVLVEMFAAEVKMLLWISSLDNMIAGGRATFLRGFIANLLRIRPILTFKRGELEVAAKISTKIDPVEHLAKTLEETFRGRRVWAAVSHGNAPEIGERLAGALQGRLEIEYLYLQPFAASIYLHVGGGALGVFVAPVDRLPWSPPLPIDS